MLNVPQMLNVRSCSFMLVSLFEWLKSPCECVCYFDGLGICLDPVDLDDVVFGVSVVLGRDCVIAPYNHDVMWVFGVNPHGAYGG